LDLWLKGIKEAQNFSLKQLNSGLDIMPQLPHTDNINDFKMALHNFHDSQQQGFLCVNYANPKIFRFTHNVIKDFSESDKIEEIGLISVDLPRKQPSLDVSQSHYALLQGKLFIIPS
jgi:hypothetical protein